MQINTIIGSLSVSLLALFGVHAVHSQPHISFADTHHRFGEISEDGGEAKHAFVFVNSGDEPLIISQVNASCGCTSSGWPKEPVAPGDSGVVVAVYKPYNRPGRFSKKLTVRSNAENAHVELRVSGLVRPKSVSADRTYPVNLQGMGVRSNYLQFGNITNEKIATRSYAVHNYATDTLMLNPQKSGSTSITTYLEPVALAPGSDGILQVSFDPTQDGVLGYRMLPFFVTTTQAQSPDKQFTLIVTVEEYFPPMSDQEIAKAPQLSFSKPHHDFGDLNQTDTVSAEFRVQNIGHQDLIIRAVKPNCACLSAVMDKTQLAPDEESILTVVMTPAGRRGIQNKSISIFSNDPRRPSQKLTLRALVKKGED